MHDRVVVSDDNAVVTDAAKSLLDLLAQVAASGYRFTTPTPLTHQRFLSHCSDAGARSHRDIFGWNRVFHRDDVSPMLLTTMANAGVLRSDAGLRSGIRIASIDADLFLHSAFPTAEEAAVFFGPDTYRFVRFVRDFIRTQYVARHAARFAESSPARQQQLLRILDIGCGSGAGGIAAARAVAESGCPYALTLADISMQALAHAAINAAFASIPAVTVLSDSVYNVAGDFDLIIANPPYLHDDARRLYRHGGDRLGRALSLRLATDALDRLAPGGTLLLYTGVAIVDGIDGLLADLNIPLQQSGCRWSYAEIDPDVFGEELTQPAYRHADRIAAVGLIATRPPRHLG